jgi:hypothetical protein
LQRSKLYNFEPAKLFREGKKSATSSKNKTEYAVTCSVPQPEVDSVTINHNIGTEVVKHGWNIILAKNSAVNISQIII